MWINNLIERNVQIDECHEVEHLAKSAALIAYHNFKWHYITLVLINATVTCGLNAFLQTYDKTTIVADRNIIPRYYSYTKQFVLFGQNLIDIIYLLKWMESYHFNNIGRFVIICQSKHSDDCDESQAVEIFWNHKIVNVIFINDKYNDAVSYTYDYGPDCKNTPPFKVGDWDDCYKDKPEYCKNKFPVKFKNLYGCPIIVSTFSQVPYMDIKEGVPYGADGDLLRIIIEALNATLVLRTPFRGTGWGNLNENGTWVGSLSDLYYDLANFSMTSASITQSRYKEFEMSNFYYAISLGWVTHPPEKEMPYYKLLRPFKIDTHISIIVSFMIIVIIVLILRSSICIYIYRKMNFGPIPNKVLFSSWEMCMGQPISPFSSKIALSYLVLIWIWYCFLMRTFYQVHLINSLKNDIYVTPFTTIEEAILAEYPIGGGSALKDYYVDNPLVYENWRSIDSSTYHSALTNLTAGMKYVLAMNLGTAKYYLRTPNTKLHILPQAIINCPTVIFFKKFSPFMEPINNILDRLVEFGWADMIFRNNTMGKKIYDDDNEDNPIQLSNFAGCYLILLAGWTLSILLLFFEMNHMKKKTKRHFI